MRVSVEEAIELIQLGARLFAFVHGKLLSKSGRLHCQTVPRDQERPHVRECREQSRNHHSDASRFRMSFKLLIREAAVVLMTDNGLGRQHPLLQPKNSRREN